MAYADYDDLLRRFRRMGEDLGTASVVNSDWIYPAEKEIEGRLSPKYAVPFTGSPPVVKELVLETVYMRWLLPNNMQAATAMQDAIDARIERLLAGKEDLIGATATVTEAGDSGSVYHNLADYKPTMDVRDAEDQHIDPDRLDDLDDEDD